MYVVCYQDFRGAIHSQRKLVKLSTPTLWLPPAPEGTADRLPDHEIRSEALGISLFTTGTYEIPHYHERTWEMYQVLEGRLKIAVKPFRLAQWEVVSLAVHDIIILTPGTFHLADSSCQHTTQVIQSPASLSDKVVMTEESEIEAANAVLRESD